MACTAKMWNLFRLTNFGVNSSYLGEAACIDLNHHSKSKPIFHPKYIELEAMFYWHFLEGDENIFSSMHMDRLFSRSALERGWVQPSWDQSCGMISLMQVEVDPSTPWRLNQRKPLWLPHPPGCRRIHFGIAVLGGEERIPLGCKQLGW